MDLFQPDHTVNLLPCDGVVYYHGPVFSDAAAARHTASLIHDIPWAHDEVVMYGKRIVTARRVAWFGDLPFKYSYSGVQREAQPWSAHLLELKAEAERRTGTTFNSCLLNLYSNGSEGMAWHSDDEKTLAHEAPIASLSFGAERRFCFKHKRSPLKTEISLQHGSRLVMQGSTQTHWLHSIPKATRITQARVNLTFRTILPQRTTCRSAGNSA